MNKLGLSLIGVGTFIILFFALTAHGDDIVSTLLGGIVIIIAGAYFITVDAQKKNQK